MTRRSVARPSYHLAICEHFYPGLLETITALRNTFVSVCEWPSWCWMPQELLRWVLVGAGEKTRRDVPNPAMIAALAGWSDNGRVYESAQAFAEVSPLPMEACLSWQVLEETLPSCVGYVHAAPRPRQDDQGVHSLRPLGFFAWLDAGRGTVSGRVLRILFDCEGACGMQRGNDREAMVLGHAAVAIGPWSLREGIEHGCDCVVRDLPTRRTKQPRRRPSGMTHVLVRDPKWIGRCLRLLEEVGAKRIPPEPIVPVASPRVH